MRRIDTIVRWMCLAAILVVSLGSQTDSIPGSHVGPGISGDNLIDGSIDATEIAADAIGTSELDMTAAFQFSGAWDSTTAGTVDFDGAVTGPSFTADPSATPSLTLDDSGFTGTTEGQIAINCPTDNDCDMTIGVESGTADALLNFLSVDTTDAGITTVTIAADETNDGALVVPENSIGPDEVAIPMQSIFFCGELGANTDTFFAGPNLVSVFAGAVPTDHTFASTACDALGNTAVATADNDIDEFQSYKINGMFCQVSAAPGAAATVMTFVDDTVATPVTCSIAAAETSCTSVIGTTTDVAADSQVAVSSLNGTDDESAQDVHCLVYISWK